MSRRVSALLIVTVVLTVTLPVLAEKTLTATEAKDHIGEQATVCGKVVSSRYAESSRGSPTFLNFDQPYPNQVFALLIWGRDRSKFGNPETSYRGKRICVTGKISDYKGVPEIVADTPSQVKTQRAFWDKFGPKTDAQLFRFLDATLRAATLDKRRAQA